MLTLTLPQEVENFIIQTAEQEQITHSELILRALECFLHEKRIQNYKNDIELLEQGGLKTLTADEVFGDIEQMIDEIEANGRCIHN